MAPDAAGKRSCTAIVPCPSTSWGKPPRGLVDGRCVGWGLGWDCSAMYFAKYAAYHRWCAEITEVQIMSLSCFDGFITISTRWIHWFCSFFRDVPQNACNTRLGKKTHTKKNRLTRNQWNFVENHSTRTMKIAHVGINLLRVDDHLSRHSSQNNGPENRLCRRKIRLTRDLWTDFWMNNVQVEKKEKRLLHKK